MSVIDRKSRDSAKSYAKFRRGTREICRVKGKTFERTFDERERKIIRKFYSINRILRGSFPPISPFRFLSRSRDSDIINSTSMAALYFTSLLIRIFRSIFDNGRSRDESTVRKDFDMLIDPKRFPFF